MHVVLKKQLFFFCCCCKLQYLADKCELFMLFFWLGGPVDLPLCPTLSCGGSYIYNITSSQYWQMSNGKCWNQHVSFCHIRTSSSIIVSNPLPAIHQPLCYITGFTLEPPTLSTFTIQGAVVMVHLCWREPVAAEHSWQRMMPGRQLSKHCPVPRTESEKLYNGKSVQTASFLCYQGGKAHTQEAKIPFLCMCHFHKLKAHFSTIAFLLVAFLSCCCCV